MEIMDEIYHRIFVENQFYYSYLSTTPIIRTQITSLSSLFSSIFVKKKKHISQFTVQSKLWTRQSAQFPGDQIISAINEAITVRKSVKLLWQLDTKNGNILPSRIPQPPNPRWETHPDTICLASPNTLLFKLIWKSKTYRKRINFQMN